MSQVDRLTDVGPSATVFRVRNGQTRRTKFQRVSEKNQKKVETCIQPGLPVLHRFHLPQDYHIIIKTNFATSKL